MILFIIMFEEVISFKRKGEGVINLSKLPELKSRAEMLEMSKKKNMAFFRQNPKNRLDG